MFKIAPWHIWIIIGIVMIIIEIFDPAFFFIALGIGAIGTGLLSLIPFIRGSIPLQIVLFALISFIAFLFTRKLGKKVLAHPAGETNVNALKGKTGHITKAIPDEGKGYVKVESEEWVAVSEDEKAIALNARVEVVKVDGNKLVVRKV